MGLWGGRVVLFDWFELVVDGMFGTGTCLGQEKKPPPKKGNE